MAKKQVKCSNINEVEAFMKNVPEDRKTIATGLFNKLEYLGKILTGLEKQIENDNDLSPATIKSYNDTVQRYGIICKQLVSILPKPTESIEGDPLMKYVAEGFQK